MRTSVVHSPLILYILSSGFRPLRTKATPTILPLIVILSTLSIPPKGLSGKFRQVQEYPEIRRASCHKPSPSEHSDSDSSSGSDYGEIYPPTRSGESSSDEGEALHLESGTMWVMNSI